MWALEASRSVPTPACGRFAPARGRRSGLEATGLEAVCAWLCRRGSTFWYRPRTRDTRLTPSWARPSAAARFASSAVFAVRKPLRAAPGAGARSVMHIAIPTIAAVSPVRATFDTGGPRSKLPTSAGQFSGFHSWAHFSPWSLPGVDGLPGQSPPSAPWGVHLGSRRRFAAAVRSCQRPVAAAFSESAR